ncbi:hypothetical protein X734_26975 [Mesorhizobium sp. L2C084A000]|nr:hypothetical protein X734_26975 [Mesorhizobium sp. L2C084A000]
MLTLFLVVQRNGEMENPICMRCYTNRLNISGLDDKRLFVQDL